MRALASRHLRGLFRFGGRETRQEFWPWVALVVAVGMTAWTLALIGMLAVVMRAGGASQIMDDAGGVMTVIALTSIVMLAAAVNRRLHDSGRGGWWGIPAPILLLTGLFVMSRAEASLRADQGHPFSGWFGAAMGVNLLYLASLALLIILCALPGETGENRYGKP